MFLKNYEQIIDKKKYIKNESILKVVVFLHE